MFARIIKIGLAAALLGLGVIASWAVVDTGVRLSHEELGQVIDPQVLRLGTGGEECLDPPWWNERVAPSASPMPRAISMKSSRSNPVEG